MRSTDAHHSSFLYLAPFLSASPPLLPLSLSLSLSPVPQGMRVVMKPEDFQESLDACRRESMKSFGDDSVLIEKFVVKPRSDPCRSCLISADYRGVSICSPDM